MVMTMKIEKQATKFVKPFVQTLPILSPYKLGFMDEFAPFLDVGIVLFFAAANHNPKDVLVERLENSLAKTLTRFYPLAGRYAEETHSVDCNDQGAEFTYATVVDTKLQDFLQVSEENVKLIDEFIPTKTDRGLQQSDPLLATQVTTFECGGVAIGVTATHKIVDASTLCTVINEWAILNREDEIKFKGSGFNSSVLLPPRGLSSYPVVPRPMNNDDALSCKYTRKKVSFNESVISKMKMKAKGTRWSKVQVVSAILWKAFMEVDLAIHNRSRESVLIQAVNLRDKMGFSIPKDSCGNLWGFFATDCKTPDEETIEELANRLSDSVKKIITDLSKGQGEEMVLNLISNITSNYIGESTRHFMTTSSWCKFPFYEADFGFGKPVWIAPGTSPLTHIAPILMDDAQGNGVEAYVFLEDKLVPYVEEALQHFNATFAA